MDARRSTAAATPQPARGRWRSAALLAASGAGLALLGLLVQVGGSPVPLAGTAGSWLGRPAEGAHAPSGPAPSGAQGAQSLPVMAGAVPAAGPDPLLGPDLRERIESLLLQAGDMGTPEALKQRLQALAGTQFPPELLPRALALLNRYVDYRVALGRLKPPADAGDPRALREALQAREAVRRQYFSDEEHDALFARDAALDQLSVARLEILRNPALSERERAEALKAAEADLPELERKARAEATAHLAVAAQNQAFDAQGLDERSRHALRSAQYGDNAAHALAQLDREERDWQQRLDTLAQAQQAGTDSAALQQLRDRLFTTDEQRRLDGALALRALRPATAAR